MASFSTIEAKGKLKKIVDLRAQGTDGIDNDSVRSNPVLSGSVCLSPACYYISRVVIAGSRQVRSGSLSYGSDILEPALQGQTS